MSVELAASAFSRALGLTDKQIKLLLRTGWVLIVSTVMLWVLGLLVWANFPGPASATEVKEIKSEVTLLKVQLMEQALFDVRLRQCKAETAEAKQYYYGRLQEKMTEYFNTTGRNYRAPDCKEIQ